MQRQTLRSMVFIAVAGTALSLFPQSVLAQQAPSPSDAAATPASSPTAEPGESDAPAFDSGRRPRELTTTLSILGSASTTADFDDDNGDVQVSRAGVDLDVSIPVAKRSMLDVGVGTKWSMYSFGGDDGFGGSEPWEDIWEYSVGGRYSYELDETWSLFGGAFVNSAGEQGADFSDTITGGGFLGVTYVASRDFYIALGAGYATRLEDDGYVIPVVKFNWQIDDKWSLGTDVAPKSIGLGVGYQATEKVKLTLSSGYEFYEYRLDDEDIAPEGVGRDARVGVLFGVNWEISPQVTFDVRTGVALAQEYELDDEGGNKIQEVDAEPAGVLGAVLSFKF